MTKNAIIGVLAAAAIFAAVAVVARRPEGPSPSEARRAKEGQPHAPTTSDHLPSAPAKGDEPRTQADLIAGDPVAARSLAKDWRRAARGDAAFRSRLAALVLDDAAAASERELAAFVLGTLPDREGLDALSDALAAAKDPRWVRTLLLALGCERTSGEDDDIFDLPHSPRVLETLLGLSVRVAGAVTEPAVRGRMVPWLRDAPDAGVRWAAAVALSDSFDFDDVRKAVLQAIPTERDPATQGELAKSMSDWLAATPADAPDRGLVFGAILDVAGDADASALRLRSEDGLKRMAWTSSDVGRVVPWIESGALDQRRWAIAVLSGAASRLEVSDRGPVFESLARVSGNDVDAKAREFAVTGLSAFGEQASVTGILIRSLGDVAWHVRAASVRSLGRLAGSPEALAALEKAERGDPDERVRRAAAETRKLLLR